MGKNKKVNKRKYMEPNNLKRIDWGGSKRYYISSVIATNSVEDDGIKIGANVIRRAFAQNKFTSFPVFIGCDTDDAPIGNCRLSHLSSIVVKGKEIIKLNASSTLIVPREIAERLSNSHTVAIYKADKKKIVAKKNYKLIKKADIIGVGLVDKKDSADEYCGISSILKDEDIDKKLEA